MSWILFFHLKLPLITHYEPVQVTLQTNFVSMSSICWRNFLETSYLLIFCQTLIYVVLLIKEQEQEQFGYPIFKFVLTRITGKICLFTFALCFYSFYSCYDSIWFQYVFFLSTSFLVVGFGTHMLGCCFELHQRCLSKLMGLALCALLSLKSLTLRYYFML